MKTLVLGPIMAVFLLVSGCSSGGMSTAVGEVDAAHTEVAVHTVVERGLHTVMVAHAGVSLN